MLRNYLITALRNLVRNRLYAGINMFGLAVGFAAAIFGAGFVRNELTYERWIPHHDRIFVLATSFEQHGVRSEGFASPREAAAWLNLDEGQVQSASRLVTGNCEVVINRGGIRTLEGEDYCRNGLVSVDPDFFGTVPLPRVAGDPEIALNEPDAVVLTRTMARKYFGRDAPLGEAIELNGHPMKVTAVIADLPSNTDFSEGFFISSRAPFSELKKWDGQALDSESSVYAVLRGPTFVRLKPSASIAALQNDMAALSERHLPRTLFGGMRMRLVPLASHHLAPLRDADSIKERTSRLNIIYGISGTGILILLAAAINFVNGMTARAARRSVEVGVRKTAGAARPQLVLQFLGESVIYVLVALAAASILVTILAPALQAFLRQPVAISPWHGVAEAGSMAGLAVLVGLLAGAYPALILSGLRPTAVLKAGTFTPTGSGAVRRALVTMQFAILVALAVVTIVMYRQFDFAMTEGLRYDLDQLLVMDHDSCTRALKAEIQALPGVRAAGCSYGGIDGGYHSTIVGPGQIEVPVSVGTVDYDAFDALGLHPLAGRFPSPQFGDDSAPASSTLNPSVVVNEAAARALGFAVPADAIGQTISWQRIAKGEKPATTPRRPSRIIGVVADYPYLVSAFPVAPHIFFADPSIYLPTGPGGRLFVKLRGRDIPETLAAIDRIWARLGDPNWPPPRGFMVQEIERNYRTLVQQARLIGVFAAVALFISGLGIFSFAAFIAERRTKEIGVRKAMGATRGDIIRLVLWDYGKPVLGANLIAWPAAYLVSQRWLEGYAYHIDVRLWMFVVPTALALVIATLTVIGHALQVARAKPVAALRYE